MTQLGFDSLLAETDATNKANAFAKQTAHLPDTMAEGIPFHKEQIKHHHQAMLDCEFDQVMSIRKDAFLLAQKLNGREHGIIANDEAAGCILEKRCESENEIPLWGQKGSFILHMYEIDIHIEMNGMFGIGASAMPHLGFSAKAVHLDQMFISESGFRSFLGCWVEPTRGMTTDGFVKCIIQSYIDEELKGKLVAIKPLRF